MSKLKVYVCDACEKKGGLKEELPGGWVGLTYGLGPIALETGRSPIQESPTAEFCCLRCAVVWLMAFAEATECGEEHDLPGWVSCIRSRIEVLVAA